MMHGACPQNCLSQENGNLYHNLHHFMKNNFSVSGNLLRVVKMFELFLVDDHPLVNPAS